MVLELVAMQSSPGVALESEAARSMNACCLLLPARKINPDNLHMTALTRFSDDVISSAERRSSSSNRISLTEPVSVVLLIHQVAYMGWWVINSEYTS